MSDQAGSPGCPILSSLLSPVGNVGECAESPPDLTSTMNDHCNNDYGSSDHNEAGPSSLVESPPNLSQAGGVKLIEHLVYHCPHCSNWCKRLSSFHDHLLGHNKEPAFTCSNCSHKGRSRSGVNWHIREAKRLEKQRKKRKKGGKEPKSQQTDHQDAGCIRIQPIPEDRYASFLKMAQIPESAHYGKFKGITSDGRMLSADESSSRSSFVKEEEEEPEESKDQQDLPEGPIESPQETAEVEMNETMPEEPSESPQETVEVEKGETMPEEPEEPSESPQEMAQVEKDQDVPEGPRESLQETAQVEKAETMPEESSAKEELNRLDQHIRQCITLLDRSRAIQRTLQSSLGAKLASFQQAARARSAQQSNTAFLMEMRRALLMRIQLEDGEIHEEEEVLQAQLKDTTEKMIRAAGPVEILRMDCELLQSKCNENSVWISRLEGEIRSRMKDYDELFLRVHPTEDVPFRDSF